MMIFPFFSSHAKNTALFSDPIVNLIPAETENYHRRLNVGVERRSSPELRGNRFGEKPIFFIHRLAGLR